MRSPPRPARLRAPGARALPGSAALFVLVAGCAAGEARPLPPVVGEPAPGYAAPTLRGDTLSLASLRGDVVLVNLWATWCPPCRREMPGLQRLQDELGAEGLRVVAVSIDAPSSAEEIRPFLEETGITFTVLHDAEQRVTRTFATTGVPETFLIGRDGVLLNRWIGEIHPGSESIRAPVRSALRKGGSAGDGPAAPLRRETVAPPGTVIRAAPSAPRAPHRAIHDVDELHEFDHRHSTGSEGSWESVGPVGSVNPGGP